MRIWEVVVTNKQEMFPELSEIPERIAYKFVVSPAAMGGMTPEGFEKVMTMELIRAIREIKGKMILAGMEP